MEALNKNIATGVGQFGDVSKSIQTLSDQTVAFMKENDPQKFYDLFAQLSQKFDDVTSSLTDQSGDIKKFITQGNQVMETFLKFSNQLKPEDLKNLGTSLADITESVKKFNDFLTNNSDDIQVLSSQLLLTSEMFVTFGKGLNFIDSKDADAMMATIDASHKILGVGPSATSLSQKTYSVAAKNLLKNASNNDVSKIAKLSKDLTPVLSKISSISDHVNEFMKNTDPNKLVSQMTDQMNQFKDIICAALNIMNDYAQKDTRAVGPSFKRNDEQKQIASRL